MTDSQDMNSAVKAFFSSPRFAVAGASSDPRKFGHRIFAWYLDHNIQPTPLNPNASTISVNNSTFDTASSVSALPNPKQTSLSFITPPSVTAKLLREAKEAGIRAVFLQPGTFDEDVLDYAKQAFPGAAVGGDGGGGSEGWCVLVDGDWGLKQAGRKDGRL